MRELSTSEIEAVAGAVASGTFTIPIMSETMTETIGSGTAVEPAKTTK